ncbi:hypothetical protein PMAYCL1PPCAC_24826, partial [Pristionchus mayeri]
MDDGYLLAFYLEDGDVSDADWIFLVAIYRIYLKKAGSMDPEMTTVMGALVPVRMKNPQESMSADEPT